MGERDPFTNASEFVSLRKQSKVIPEDQLIGLLQRSTKAGLRREKHRIRQVNKRKEYLSKIESLLEQAPISPFFKKQLLYEEDLGWTEEFIGSNTIEDSAFSLLGISLKEGQAGIFEPKNSFFLELNYFYKIAPLLRYREKRNFPTPVSWKEWEEDLDRRRKGESKL